MIGHLLPALFLTMLNASERIHPTTTLALLFLGACKTGEIIEGAAVKIEAAQRRRKLAKASVPIHQIIQSINESRHRARV